MSKNDDGWEDKLFDKFIDEGFGLAKALVTNPAGIGLISILGGVAIKSLGAGNPAAKSGQAYRLTEKARESISSQDENQYCTLLKGRFPATFEKICETYDTSSGKKAQNPLDPVIDVFPFQFPGLVREELGEIHLSDLMLLAGVLAIGGQAVEKIVEKVL